MEYVDRLRFPRWYGTEDAEIELHIFCDAGENAKVAAAYAVQRNNLSTSSRLIASKVKLAAINNKSIPRQELDAFVLAVKLMEVISQGLDLHISNVYIWTDAQDVLYWLNNTRKRFSTFVSSRVNFIREKTSPEQWRYVSSKETRLIGRQNMLVQGWKISFGMKGQSF